MNVPKIILLTRKFSPDIGGVPNYYKNLLLNLKNIDVTIITKQIKNHDKSDAIFEEKGVTIKRVDFIPQRMGLQLNFNWIASLVKIVIYIKKVIKQHEIDFLIVGQARIFFLLAAFIIRVFQKKPYLLFLHGEEIPQIKFKSTFISEKLYRQAAGYFCNSKFTAQNLVKFLQDYDLKPIIITPGVEDRFFNESESESIKNNLNLGSKRILYTIARLDERKGQDMMIEALPLVIKKYPNIVYLIGGEGPRLHYLTELVENHSLQKYVRFLGLVPEDEIVAYHRSGEIFIHPNRTLKDGDTEGFGIVFLEANAAGNPVIGGRAGGAVDAIVDGETGFLVNPLDPQDIAEKVCWLLEYKSAAHQMGEQGRQRSWEEFRWQIITNTFEKAILKYFQNMEV